MLCTHYSCQISMWNLNFPDRFLKKYWNIKFHDKPSTGSCAVPCGWTDRHDKANSHFNTVLRTHPKTQPYTTNIQVFQVEAEICPPAIKETQTNIRIPQHFCNEYLPELHGQHCQLDWQLSHSPQCVLTESHHSQSPKFQLAPEISHYQTTFSIYVH